MNQSKKNNIAQVFYCGRWVNRNNFRVFVYNESGQKLANTYEEYLKLIESGLWFSSKDFKKTEEEKINSIAKRGRKPKNAIPNS